ncbi:uncharacterized protein LOC132464624 isoform X2 [Gadus macrocephalus]|uniref:uncharacterized protein LOC132464624 isoform X2 n=1 Tax=Gadus macrocephalus TaxID=80720 RepID=UPI0028CB5AC6|nr:uncharacterized protein LOC132464624 isoform X2 [Gadus macrocephalus]
MEQYQTGCNTSDLQSEAEQECGPPDKRQRRPVHRFGDSDQSEEDVEDVVSQLEALPVLPSPSQFPWQTPLSRKVPGSRFAAPQPGENCPASHHGAGLHHPAPALSMQRVTQGAVRKNVVTRSATDAEVTKHAIRWFNLAADRAARRRVPPPSTPPPE